MCGLARSGTSAGRRRDLNCAGRDPAVYRHPVVDNAGNSQTRLFRDWPATAHHRLDTDSRIGPYDRERRGRRFPELSATARTAGPLNPVGAEGPGWQERMGGVRSQFAITLEQWQREPNRGSPLFRA